MPNKYKPTGNPMGAPSESRRKAVVAIVERRAVISHRVYTLDCVEWLRDQVKTRDEHEKVHPVKKFPMHPYVPGVVNVFNAERVTFMEKSRQMTMSWLTSAYGLHAAQFFDHQLVLVISEKFEKSASLVDRMRFIYERQAPWLVNLCPLDRQMRDQPIGTLSFRNGSKILALPDGPDQVRMHTASLAILDEADFHPMFKKTYEACLPAVAGGGKLIALSTVNAGPFSRMCDTAEPGNVMVKGMTISRIGTGPALLKLHYSADPAKDPETTAGKRWRDAAARDYPDGGLAAPGWRREMEMDATAGSGELALPFFEEISPTILLESYLPKPTDTLFGGLDVGRNNPTAFLVAALTQDGTFIFFYEWYQKHVLLDEMAREIKRCIWYDRMEQIACDPSIWDKNQYKKDGMVSLASMLQEDVEEKDRLDKMFRAHGRSDMQFLQKFSIMALNKQKLSDGTEVAHPKVLISRTGCPNLIRELRGLRYREISGNRNNSEKLVDQDNHSVDAAKYVLLSHPEGRNFQPHAKVGTVGFLREKGIIADLVAEETGMSFEEAFANG
jgi:hypothetical protein